MTIQEKAAASSAGTGGGWTPTAPTANDLTDIPLAQALEIKPEEPLPAPEINKPSAGVTNTPQDGRRTVEVIAPSDLPAGYNFYVDSGNNQSLLVEVPHPGVRATQRFHAIVLREVNKGAHNVPTGRWRDGLCDCFRFGCCHPQCCLTFWCNPCALGQVLTRLKLNWCAASRQVQDGMSAFKIYFAIYVVYLVATWVLAIIIGQFRDEDNEDNDWNYEGDPDWLIGIRILRVLIDLALFLTIFFVTMKLRRYIRDKYRIPAETCGGEGCEDCCCAFWCQPCTVCQMARHTADYHQYSAGCCTEDGLAGGAPEVV